jgi:succinoglycan biosynthesis protein ExoA
MLKDFPQVSVIIPCRDERDDIGRCLRAALEQDYPSGKCEVIVADGSSTDGTRDEVERIAKENPGLRIVENPSGIVSTGLNAGIRAANGAIIVRMDAHTEYAEDYVRNCVETLIASGADNVGGAARTRPAQGMEGAITLAYHSPFAVGGARFHDVNYEGYLDTVTYGCWRRELFNRVGFFDEELVRNQDDEHNLRITRSGGKIWQSRTIRSWYRPRASLRALFRQYSQYGYWKVRVIQKHRLPASIRHIVPGGFLLLLLALTVLVPFVEVAGAVLLGAVICYLLGALSAALLTGWRAGWRTSARLMPVFACYHFGYGYGFLHGMLNFLVLRRGRNEGFSTMTRSRLQPDEPKRS